jgi:hypothetical protein
MVAVLVILMIVMVVMVLMLRVMWVKMRSARDLYPHRLRRV